MPYFAYFKTMPSCILRWLTLCGVCFSLNKSTSYMSLCVSFNSSWDEISRMSDSQGTEPFTEEFISSNKLDQGESNQPILKEISPGCSLEGLMLKLKLQYFGQYWYFASILMWRADSFEKTLMLGKIEGRRRRGWQRMRWLHGITDSMDMSLGKL